MRIVRDDARIASLKAELREAPMHQLERGDRYGIQPVSDGIGAWFQDQAWFLIATADRRIVTSRPDGRRRAAWEHLLLAFALPILLEAQGAIVLHGSSIDAGAGAYLLCGPSGRGKTTTSLALVEAGATLLSDDVTVLESDAHSVWPGPRGSRILGADGSKTLRLDAVAPAVGPTPVKAIVVLEPRGAGGGLRQLPAADAFLALLSHASPINGPGDETRFRAIADVARDVPVLTATLPDDLSALPRAAAALLVALASHVH